MLNLRFDRISHFIVLSSVGKNNSNPKASTFYLSSPQEVRISFFNYVKSQVHINIAGTLYGRSVSSYASVYRYLNGTSSDKSRVNEVLRYYYEDMANSLINNKEPLIIGIDSSSQVDSDDNNEDDREQILYYSYLDVSKELDLIVYEEDPYTQIEMLDNCKYIEIFSKVDSIEEYEKKKYNFSIAAILLLELSDTILKRVKIGE